MVRQYCFIFYNPVHAYLKMYPTFSFLKRLNYSPIIPPGIIKQCKLFHVSSILPELSVLSEESLSYAFSFKTMFNYTA